MQELVVFALVGALGGLVRALVGARKSMLRRRPFVWQYFLGTILVALSIGAIVGGVLGTSKAVALAAGYAGSDLLEGVAKGLRLIPQK